MMTQDQLTHIHPISVLQDNYVWAILDQEQENAFIIDPGEAAPVLDFLREHQLALRAILITHHHWDHTGGITEIVKNIKTPVYGPAKENIPHLTHPLTAPSPFVIDGFPQSIEVLDIPGHTAGHVAYYLAGNLFCGDTLFAAGCGRIFEGTPVQMFASLQKIAALNADTQIYCAHEYTLNNLRFAKTVEPNNQTIAQRLQYVTELRNQGQCSLPSTLKEEKETNPFLRCHVPAVKASVEQYAKQYFDNDNVVDVFAALRKWKDGF